MTVARESLSGMKQDGGHGPLSSSRQPVNKLNRLAVIKQRSRIRLYLLGIMLL